MECGATRRFGYCQADLQSKAAATAALQNRAGIFALAVLEFPSAIDEPAARDAPSG
jgi:hypothetical protein